MKTLVTGGTGLIGSHLVECLVAAGDEVRVLVRAGSDVSHLRTLGVELVPGDLGDASSLERALRGVEVVHHNAARVSDSGRWRDFASVAIEGTARLLRAAERAGASRFVHMSSASVYGLRRIRGRRVDETTPIQRPPLSDPYARSKILSERLVLRHARRSSLGITVLRPTFVYGARDRAVLPRLVRLLQEGRLVVAGRGDNPLHLIHASDVAQAAFRAGRRERACGRIYLLDGGDRMGQRDFLTALARGVGARPPARSLPLPLLWGLALAEEARSWLLPRAAAPSRTRYLVAFCGGEARFDTSRAQRELGFRPRVEVREGLADALAWWHASRPGQRCTFSVVRTRRSA